MARAQIPNVAPAEIEAICKRHHVAELALFGSRAVGRARDDSDVDLLVAFEPGALVTFMTLGRIQAELEDLLGLPVDLVPRDGLKALIRDDVLASAQVLYAA